MLHKDTVELAKRVKIGRVIEDNIRNYEVEFGEEVVICEESNLIIDFYYQEELTVLKLTKEKFRNNAGEAFALACTKIKVLFSENEVDEPSAYDDFKKTCKYICSDMNSDKSAEQILFEIIINSSEKLKFKDKEINWAYAI